MNQYTCPLCGYRLAKRMSFRNMHRYLACTNSDCNYTKQTKVYKKIKQTTKNKG